MALLQDAVVTAAAIWAGWIVFRRVAGFARPKSATPGCASCPTATIARRQAADEHPLVFFKSRH